MKSSLAWTVKRLAGAWVILADVHGNEFSVPRGLIPAHVKIGDLVTAEFYLLKDKQKRQENLARAVLEEILGSR